MRVFVKLLSVRRGRQKFCAAHLNVFSHFFWSASGLKFVRSEMNHTACGLLHKWWRKLGHKMKRQFGEGISCNVGVGPDRTPPFGSLPGTSKWEGNPAVDPEHAGGIRLCVPSGLGTPREELGSVSGKRDIWNTLRASFHCFTNKRETEWMDGWKLTLTCSDMASLLNKRLPRQAC